MICSFSHREFPWKGDIYENQVLFPCTSNRRDFSFAERCAGCHAEKPTQPGFAAPPLGVMLDSPERIKAAAPRIYQQVIATQAMPLGNLTQMTDNERALIGHWLADGAKLND